MATAAVLDKPVAHDLTDSTGLTRLTDLTDFTDLTGLTDGLFVVASAPAGWYDIDEVTRRWFDGRGWTGHYAPILRLVPDIGGVALHIRTNHGFHLIMVIMTLGVWAPIWVTVGACNFVRSLERSRGVAPRG